MLAGLDAVEVAHLAGVEVRGALERRGVGMLGRPRADPSGAGDVGSAPPGAGLPCSHHAIVRVIHGSTT